MAKKYKNVIIAQSGVALVCIRDFGKPTQRIYVCNENMAELEKVFGMGTALTADELTALTGLNGIRVDGAWSAAQIGQLFTQTILSLE